MTKAINKTMNKIMTINTPQKENEQKKSFFTLYGQLFNQTMQMK